MQQPRAADFAIFVHVFYPDIWEEMAADLARLRQPFDLVITRPAGSQPVLRPRTDFLCSVMEMEVENRGRDILPFLTALRHQPPSTAAIGLKLHTKRSPHRSDGEDWRRFLTNTLLEADGEGKLLGHAMLEAEPRIGLVAPRAHLLPLRGRTSLNEGVMAATLERIAPGAALSALEESRFAAGSMFWFRRDVLQGIVAADLAQLFVRENGQLDGTAAHALERLFAFVVEQNEFVAAAMENARPILGDEGNSLSREQLSHLINQTLAHDNPYVMPLGDFWRRYPALLKVAHAFYARMPKGAVRFLRRSLRR